MEPHVILGVSANASEKDINDAHRVLKRKWRPDSNLRYVKEATEMMKEINAAHRTMLRCAARAKATAHAGESSSSLTYHNPSSSAEYSTSTSSQASSSYTPREKRSSSNGSDRIPPLPPYPNRKQSKDSDHRPQRTFSSFLPQPFRRYSSSTNPSPPSPDIDLTNEYNESFLVEGWISKEWVHPIKFTLEDLFHGKRFKVHIERYRLVGKRRPVVLVVDVPAGCATGSEIMFENAGHESRDGRRQDIVFVIEEANHRDFTRTQDDVSIDVEFPWDDRLTEGRQSMRLEGLDGEDVLFTIGPCRDHAMEGTILVPGAGMPICGDPFDGRGNLFIHWGISKTGSRWLRKVFRMKASSYPRNIDDTHEQLRTTNPNFNNWIRTEDPPDDDNQAEATSPESVHMFGQAHDISISGGEFYAAARINIDASHNSGAFTQSTSVFHLWKLNHTLNVLENAGELVDCHTEGSDSGADLSLGEGNGRCEGGTADEGEEMLKQQVDDECLFPAIESLGGIFKRGPKTHRENLQMVIIPSTATPSLHPTIADDVVYDILSNYPRRSIGDHRSFERILQALLVSFSPLSSMMIAALFDLNNAEHVEQILRPARPLVFVPKWEDKNDENANRRAVRFICSSTVEFFLDRTRGREYFVDVPSAHRMFLDGCTSVMEKAYLGELRFDVLGHGWRDAYEYACQNWERHRRAGIRSKL